jgi:hypothetical protein
MIWFTPMNYSNCLSRPSELWRSPIGVNDVMIGSFSFEKGGMFSIVDQPFNHRNQLWTSTIENERSFFDERTSWGIAEWIDFKKENKVGHCWSLLENVISSVKISLGHYLFLRDWVREVSLWSTTLIWIKLVLKNANG